MSQQQLPKIGITLGDYNGIGVEIILKALQDTRILQYCVPIVFGSVKVISFYRKMLEMNEINFNYIKSIDQANLKRPNLFTVWEEETEIKPGQPSPVAGNYAFKSLEAVVSAAKAGLLDAIVTAPIDKNTIQNENFKFPGHTEYLAKEFGADKSMMLLTGEDLCVGLVTGHVPLKDVSSHLSQEKIMAKLRILNNSLQTDFGITKPRIAVLALNPHAGDGGLLGREEIEIITPAIEKIREDNILAFGPFASDGFFAARQHKKYDAVLAMYHDQGLIPFKYLEVEDGVNYTAGLPVIRTSPDHGTAYDIAGKNKASESSMRSAIYMAIDLLRTRNRENDLRENPLKFIPLKKERFRMEF
ncbi:MAG TPA: 4-hydroxythreonine-4-phosphate dehydrogenase PdxA [Bacteroidia bacterium]|nr:4-hydroxythreonine-4-phosphate dehydrogenase PdxA [Bacteroidia bacterium]